jgi:hypothetical protein
MSDEFMYKNKDKFLPQPKDAEPRERWINPYTWEAHSTGHGWRDVEQGLIIHAIEHSAYEALRLECERLQKKLEHEAYLCGTARTRVDELTNERDRLAEENARLEYEREAVASLGHERVVKLKERLAELEAENADLKLELKEWVETKPE